MSSAINRTYTISETTPAAAGTAASTLIAGGLDRYESVSVDAELVGATGGALDVYLQRRVVEPSGTEVWIDWCHFPQLAAGAAAVKYSSMAAPAAGITVVGKATSPALAANTMIGGHPGEALRALYVAGAGTSAGAAVKIHITGVRDLTRC